MTTKVKASECSVWDKDCAKYCEPGKWYEHGGQRMICLGPSSISQCAVFARRDYMLLHYSDTLVTPLPDCTGWDWQPLVLHEGRYYELKDGTIVGPLTKNECGQWQAKLIDDPSISYWFDEKGCSPTASWSIVREVEPPKPAYRKDAWEFLEHAKARRIVYTTFANGSREYGIGMVDLRTNEANEDVTLARFWNHSFGWTPWLSAQSMLKQCIFNDTGEPCGVKEQ